jgi:hypothetical protein
MIKSLLTVRRLERRLSMGTVEPLIFESGVNVLVGRPNTGKTRWLQTLDYLLGDSGGSPFEGADDEHLAQKYDGASAELFVGGEQLLVERRWNEPGVKTKVFVNSVPMAAPDFQRLLLEKLGIPVLHFPKGNPMSGQTWPELSFRMLLRHIYRRQRPWGDIADLQPDGEQHACLLQFVGLAERIFTEEYGHLIKLKIESEQLRARRDQYEQTLRELAGELLAEPELQGAVSPTTVRSAETLLENQMNSLREKRDRLLVTARTDAVPAERRGRTEELGEQRASLIISLEELRRHSMDIVGRLSELRTYRSNLSEELDRIARANDAGEVLADLRVTHCPACDQPVQSSPTDNEHCFLCHQILPELPPVEGLGAVRLKFESNRLTGELDEAKELLDVLLRDSQRIAAEIRASEESLRMVENELAPMRNAVSSLVHEQLSAIDMALGGLNERQRQLGRLKRAVASGVELGAKIREKEKEIEPLEAKINELARATDFGDAEARLAEGMNEYLSAINVLKPGIWRHSPISVDISRYSFRILVGAKRWQSALGGTDSLYFLMAYHYGLLTLSDKEGCHYPGLSILDMPAEFAGESIEDKENFIVQPFIELLRRDQFQGAQVIITGASFAGLEGAARHRLVNVHVA